MSRRPAPSSDSDSAQIAAFLAARGATRIPEGERTLSERELWQHRTDPGRLSRARLDAEAENRLIAQRRVVIDGAGREFVVNGLGERIA